MKRIAIPLISACLVAACSSPPKPPQPSGSYRPINPVSADSAPVKAPTTIRANNDVGINPFGGEGQ